MKSTYKEDKKDNIYPCLMRSIIDGDDIIIMAIKDTSNILIAGIAVYSEDPHTPLGHYSETWCKNCFIPYFGSVTINSK